MRPLPVVFLVCKTVVRTGVGRTVTTIAYPLQRSTSTKDGTRDRRQSTVRLKDNCCLVNARRVLCGQRLAIHISYFLNHAYYMSS
jgi:hypothetical protein